MKIIKMEQDGIWEKEKVEAGVKVELKEVF